MDDKPSRRSVTAAVGTAVVGTVSGCLGVDNPLPTGRESPYGEYDTSGIIDSYTWRAPGNSATQPTRLSVTVPASESYGQLAVAHENLIENPEDWQGGVDVPDAGGAVSVEFFNTIRGDYAPYPSRRFALIGVDATLGVVQKRHGKQMISVPDYDTNLFEG